MAAAGRAKLLSVWVRDALGMGIQPRELGSVEIGEVAATGSNTTAAGGDGH